MALQNSPGCCCTNCTVFSDDFADDTITGWTQDNGSWTESGGTLNTSSTGAAISIDTLAESTEIRIWAQAYGSNGDKVRLCVNYEDEDNYLCGEFTLHDSGSGSIAIIDRVGGSDSTLTSKSSLTIDDGDQLYVCFQNGVVYAANVDGGGSDCQQSSVVESPTNKKAALATGGTLTGTVSFDNLSVVNANTAACAVCSCPITCSVCADSEAPNWWTVRVSDYNTEMNGVHVVPKGFDSCTWECTNNFEGWYPKVTVLQSGSDYILRVTVNISGTDSTWEHNFGTSKPDCMNVDLTLSYVSGNHSDATIAIVSGRDIDNPCECYFANCRVGKIPQTMTAVVTGIANDSCSDCGDLNATYVMDWYDNNCGNNQPDDFGQSGCCVWQVVLESEICNVAIVRLMHGKAVPRWYLQFLDSSFVEVCTIRQPLVTPTADCDTWSDVTFDVGTASTPQCDMSSVQALLTSSDVVQ